MSTERTARVVVADDEERIADAHARMLPDAWDVTTVYGGEEALAAIDEGVDVALLDRNMPDLEGDEVVSRLRERGHDPVVIMVTAVEPDFDIIEMGFDDYLVKPVDEATLRDRVDTWLDRSVYGKELRDYFSLSSKWETLEEYKSDEEIEKRVLNALHGATRDLMKAESEDEIAGIATETAYTVLQFPGTEVHAYDPGEDVLVSLAVDGVETDQADEQPHRDVRDSPHGEAFRRGETMVFEYEGEDQAAIAPFSKVMVVPLGQAGVLSVGKISDEPFTETERKFTETLAENARVAMEQSQRERELDIVQQVLGRVLRHNIRNELNGVIGCAELLAENIDETDDSRDEMVDTILTNARRVLQKSEKARAVQKVIEHGRGRTRLEVTRLVTRSLDRLRERFPDADVTLDLPEEQWVLADAAIEEAIANVLENAIQHGGEDPTVRVDLAADDQEWVTLQVHDDGPGIPKHEIDAITRQRETDLEHGSGLGLYLVDWILERSGGDLAFETDHGTTVRLKLRRAAPEAPAEAGPPVGTDPEGEASIDD